MEQDTTETPIFVYCPSPSSEMEVLTSAALVCIYVYNLLIYKFVGVGKIIICSHYTICIPAINSVVCTVDLKCTNHYLLQISI